MKCTPSQYQAHYLLRYLVKQTLKLALILKGRKSLRNQKKIEILELVVRELHASEASSRQLLKVLRFQGNMGGMTCSNQVKPLPPKERELFIQ